MALIFTIYRRGKFHRLLVNRRPRKRRKIMENLLSLKISQSNKFQESLTVKSAARMRDAQVTFISRLFPSFANLTREIILGRVIESA